MPPRGLGSRDRFRYAELNVEFMSLGRSNRRPSGIKWLAERDISILRLLRRHCKNFLKLVQTKPCNPSHTNVIEWLAEIAQDEQENIPPSEKATRAWRELMTAINDVIPTPWRWLNRLLPRSLRGY